MVDHALDAHTLLAKDHISARIIDMYSIKPLDTILLQKCINETKAIITVEEHSIIGGLGSAVAEQLAEGKKHIPFTRMGIRDKFCESGDPKDLMKKYGLTGEHIAETAKQLLKK